MGETRKVSVRISNDVIPDGCSSPEGTSELELCLISGWPVMWSSTVVCDPVELEHDCGNAVRDRRRGQIKRVQVPGQVFRKCQVRPAMAEGVHVEDDGPETS
jgi:hypothetical protein